MERDMTMPTAVPNHIKVIGAIFVCFVLFQLYFQSSVTDPESLTQAKPTINLKIAPNVSITIDPKATTSKKEKLIEAPVQTVKPAEPKAVSKPKSAPKKQPPQTKATESSANLKGANYCGGPNHSSLTRPCASNDTNCGDWNGRFWKPTNCVYRDITSEQARKCMGKRTLSFIGDTQVRDLATGVSLFLLGKTLEKSSKFKVDHKLNNHMDVNGTVIPDFSKGNSTDAGGMGYVFPQPDVAKSKGWKWQVQYYAVYRKKGIRDIVSDILNNKFVSQWDYLHPIDLAFWVHGLQDYGWWNKQPIGEKFYESMAKEWVALRKDSTVPSVWMSFNHQCLDKLKNKGGTKGQMPKLMDEINTYMNVRCMQEKLPYWDIGAVLRTPDHCDVLDDGIHVKMYVDVMRAKMLFNHLCDENMNWRGKAENFI